MHLLISVVELIVHVDPQKVEKKNKSPYICVVMLEYDQSLRTETDYFQVMLPKKSTRESPREKSVHIVIL